MRAPLRRTAMGRTVVCFMIEKSRLRDMTRRRAGRLRNGEKSLPEYAGTTQRVIRVFIEHKNQKATKIIEARGYDYRFDQQGRLIPYQEGRAGKPWRLSEQEWIRVGR